MKQLSTIIALLLGFVMQADADVVRSDVLIQSIPVQGVTLSMTPRQAFETLMDQGYRAGEIESFENWRGGAIEFVRGDRMSPKGESSVLLGRQSGRLININETTNIPRGDRLDPETEIAAVRRHLDIADDERGCTVNKKRGAGVCSVSDGNKQKPLAYLIQVRPTARMILLGYAFEMTSDPDE